MWLTEEASPVKMQAKSRDFKNAKSAEKKLRLKTLPKTSLDLEEEDSCYKSKDHLEKRWKLKSEELFKSGCSEAEDVLLKGRKM